ncbi:MAG: sigma-70 family RNA polymerase sigma factor [Burkholderiaceae bacterium]
MRAWLAHEAELLGFLQHQLGDPHRAEDVLQEVFLKAMRQGRSFCEVRQPRAWLFQVARTSLIDDVRRQRATEPLDTEWPAPAPDDALPVDALAECVERNLPRLEPGDQDVLRRCDLDGWRQQDYADRNGLTLAATKARLRRARTRLRTLLIEHCGVRFDGQGAVCCTVPPAPPTD